MPLPALLAIFIAFWFESSTEAGPLPRPELIARLWQTLGLLGLVAGVAFTVGRGVAWRVARRGSASPRARRVLAWGSRALDVMALVAFAGIIHWLGWPRMVRSILGGGDGVLIDDALILAPYLLAQTAVWWGLYAAERAARHGRARAGLTRYLTLNARQALGLVLPVALAFALGQDLLHRLWPEAGRTGWVQLAAMTTLGAAVLALAPALVRLSWPTRPLPPGPLRERLERLARRCRFRYTDILVWDTGGAVVNAGVTGATPFFRYVLISDALLEYLEERQVEAVFGHEIGHVAHRHLGYFGLFFLGSLGVMALAGDAIDRHVRAGSPLLAGLTSPSSVEFVKGAIALLGVGLYFLVVFGFLSRRLERQSDVFGSRSVSCGRTGCPPHLDLNASPDAAGGLTDLCPVGIRTFANALASVAALNGIAPRTRSWRHGSIRGRIAFLEDLEGRPDAERQFQTGIARLRIALAMVLAAALLLAWFTGALKHLE